MTHFELNLPAANAVLFDKTLDEFIKTELISRPDIDVRVTRYSVEPDVERRAVFLSSAEHMEVLLKRLHTAVG